MIKVGFYIKNEGNIYMITKIKNIKNAINEELEYLNFNFDHTGTKYLIDAIYLLYCQEIFYKFSLESQVYPIIANKYGDTASAIKGAIEYATDKMYYECDEEILREYIEDEEYWGKKNQNFKPGPKKIIRAVLRNIKDM